MVKYKSRVNIETNTFQVRFVILENTIDCDCMHFLYLLYNDMPIVLLLCFGKRLNCWTYKQIIPPPWYKGAGELMDPQPPPPPSPCFRSIDVQQDYFALSRKAFAYSTRWLNSCQLWRHMTSFEPSSWISPFS